MTMEKEKYEIELPELKEKIKTLQEENSALLDQVNFYFSLFSFEFLVELQTSTLLF